MNKASTYDESIFDLYVDSRRDMLKTANAFLKKWTITDVDDGEQFVFYFKEVN